ncbi:hypothetical protein CPC08DRAFT_122484 [Agrocybe pediades]|nr:hypothetical protein CPC08DRAFT_122484 [Agrocybe pediades]
MLRIPPLPLGAASRSTSYARRQARKYTTCPMRYEKSRQDRASHLLLAFCKVLNSSSVHQRQTKGTKEPGLYERVFLSFSRQASCADLTYRKPCLFDLFAAHKLAYWCSSYHFLLELSLSGTVSGFLMYSVRVPINEIPLLSRLLSEREDVVSGL